MREDILERLLAVVAGIPNIRRAERNNTDLPDDYVPAANIYDGDEETKEFKLARPGNPSGLHIVEMTPVIQISEQSNEVGSDIATLRRELIKRVLNDAALLASVGTNGAIHYAGCQTDLYTGRKFAAALTAEFVFKYPLKIEEL